MKREQAEELAKQAISELEQALKEGKSETLLKFLSVMSRFHHYSFSNTMLVYLQKPDATQVAGFHAWRKLGRTVKKGEKGIGIFAPMVYKPKDGGKDQSQVQETDSAKKSIRGFKVVHVFDVSQTEGEDLPEFAKASGGNDQLLTAIETLIEESQIDLEYELLEGSVEGISSGGKITIDARLSISEKFSVAAHELAHERLHKGERRESTSKTVRETEAEAVAFVVCNAFGVDTKTKSSDYIQLYQGTTETLSESLSFIQKTAEWMIEELSVRLEASTATPTLASCNNG